MATKPAAKKKATEPDPKIPGLDVKQDDVGKAAEAYLKSIDASAKAKVKQSSTCAALVELMRKKKRKSISLKGRTITLSHVEAQDQIKVKKASDK